MDWFSASSKLRETDAMNQIPYFIEADIDEENKQSEFYSFSDSGYPTDSSNRGPVTQRYPLYLSGIKIGERELYLLRYPNGYSHIQNWPSEIGTDEEPWLTRRAIEFIYNNLTKRKKTARLLEFGAGSSTPWFLKVVNCSSVTSIEHDKKWLDEIEQKIPEDLKERWTPEFRPETLEAYANYIDELDPFDVILVDGEFREQCIQKSIPKLNEGGLLIVDNAERNPKDLKPIPEHWEQHEFPTRFNTTVIWIKKELD